MKVKDIMVTRIITVPEERTVQEAANIMADYGISSLVVSNVLGSYVGIITEHDLMKKVVAKGKYPTNTQVKDTMSTTLYTIDSEASLIDAARLMEEKSIRRLLITVKGKIQGIITNGLLLRNIRYSMAENLINDRRSYLLRDIE
ncbi:MAG: CBS domain-containing protein [Nanoarchaeota archaeon]